MTFQEIEKYLELGEVCAIKGWGGDQCVFIEPTTLLNPKHFTDKLLLAGVNKPLKVERELKMVTQVGTLVTFIPGCADRTSSDWYVKSYTLEQNRALPENQEIPQVA